MSATVRDVQVRHWALLAFVTAAGLALADRSAVLGIVFGGVVIGSSLLLYSIGVPALLGRGNVRLAIVLLFAKLLLLLGLVWVVFRWGRDAVDPIGFALGTSCFPVAAVWEALLGRKD